MKHLFVVALMLLFLVGGCGKKTEIQQQLVPVTVQTVQSSGSGGGIRYSATIKPDVQLDLSFKVGGYIDEIMQVRGADGRTRNLQEGDFVRRGTLLARVRESEYRDRLMEAQAALTQAKADFNRAAQLFENKTISKADYDAANARYASAQARYNQAAMTLKDCALAAPMDGFVLKRTIELGTLVSPGMPGFVLADTRVVKAAFGVPDVVIGSTKMGSVQLITTEALPGVELRGRITRVAPSADPNSRVFEVECTIPNPENKLKVGMIAALKLNAQDAPIALMAVPLNAIVRPKDDPKGYAIYVIEEREGKTFVRSRHVKLGDVVGNTIVVTDGVQGGERIVVRGATIVTDAQEVKIIPG